MNNMYENQFIQFTEDIAPRDNCMPLPVVLGGEGVAFFAPTDRASATTFTIVDANGEPITRNGKDDILSGSFAALTGNYVRAMFGDYDDTYSNRRKMALFDAEQMREFVAPDECFRLKCFVKGATYSMGGVASFVQHVDATEISYTMPTRKTITMSSLTDKTFAAGTYHLKMTNIQMRYWGSNGVPYDCQMPTFTVRAGSKTISQVSTSTTPFSIDVEFTVDKEFQLSMTADFGYYSGGRTSGNAFSFYCNEAILNQETPSKTYFSSLMRRYENDNNDFALLTYTCYTETFDLPFTASRVIRQWLPIWIDKPQFTQKDEIYEKLSGERVVLYATINKEMEAQTEYITQAWHERIVFALSCDEVYINGERLTKSDSYEIDWNNYIDSDCVGKLTKATWKMVANVTSRNSNN